MKKLSEGTGIPQDEIDIKNLYLTTNNGFIAQITSSPEDMHNFFVSAADVQKPGFNIFPSIPTEAKPSKKSLENKMKELMKLEKRIRYQVRNGERDI